MTKWFTSVGWRHLVGVLAVMFSLFPIVFVLSAALNPLGTLSSTEALPTGFTVDNFTNLFNRTAFGHWYLNSILIAGVASATAVFLSMLAAYAFSRMRFAGRRVGLVPDRVGARVVHQHVDPFGKLWQGDRDRRQNQLR